ncbi:MAG: NAAT family transporter [Alphaproteobacteria bacterium]|nr:NAAT family transporter [Alphaproteobacteria bacterium]
MTEFVVSTFVTLLIIIDPLAVSPVFLGMTRHATSAQKRAMALKGTLIAGGILLVFALAGAWLLKTLGIGMPAFRIAGGVLLFLIAVDMVLARQSGIRSTTPPENEEADHKEDISVFPLAIPLIAGPGAMTTVMLLMSRTEGDHLRQAIVLGVLVIVLATTFVCLVGAGQLARLLGVTGTNVINRVLGIVLAALAVQFILDGIRA